jgi:hypothetical protein
VKICGTCKEYLPITSFHKQTKSVSGFQHNCKECAKKRTNRHKKENIKDYQPKWRETQLRKIGFTSELFDEMLESQGNVCALCGSDKPGGRWNRFFADHNHNTGKARGVLCFHCNTALGIIEARDSNWMSRARLYLDERGI